MPTLSLQLKYPPFDVKLKKEGIQTYIFDFVRKKWLVLTPEEWVRQHLLNFLISIKKYPGSLIAIEKEIELNNIKKRFDLVVYDKFRDPLVLIECKAPFIELDTSVIEQVLRYNLVVKSKFVMITNGVSDVVFDENNLVVDLPSF